MAQGKVGSLYFTLGVNASDFEKKLNMATAKIADFGKNAERVGRSLSMSLTLPLSLLGGAAAKTAMDFETSMAKIEGLVGVAGDEVRAMGDEARKMAIKMGKSANEAAEALFFITSAGLRGKEAMDVLAASMQASVAGLGETKVVADLATSAVNAYGAANLGATEATDVMVAAVREGKLETNELAQSMGRVLPLASAMGVSFNEVGAAFAALSRTGTNASEAATQIRGILSSLLNPSKQAADELERLGLSGEMIRQVIKEDGLLAALELLKDRFEGNEEAAALVFGNIRALSGVLDLLGANVDTTRQIFENMNDVAGDTQAAFDVMAQTAQFKLNTAIASAKDGLIDLGSAIMISLTPVLEKLGEALKNLTEWFRGLSPEGQNMVVMMGALAAAAGPLLVVVGKLATMIPMLVTGFAALTGPVGLAVIAIGASVAIFVELYKSSEELRDSIGRLLNAVDNVFGSILQLINAIIAPFGLLIDKATSLGDVWGVVFGVIAGTLNAITGRLIGLAQLVSGVIRAMTYAATLEFKKSAVALANGMQGALDALDPSKMASDFMGAFNNVIKNTKVESPQVGLTGKGSAVYAAPSPKTDDSLEILPARINSANTAAVTLKDTFDKLFASVNKNDIFTKLADDIKNKFISAVDSAVNPFQRIEDILLSVGEKVDVFDGLGDKIKEEFDPIHKLFAAISEQAKENPMEEWADNLGVFAQRAIQSVQGMAQGLGMALASNTGDFKSWALSVINTLLQAASAALLAGELIKLGPIGLVTALAGIGILQGIIAGLSNNMNKNVPQFATGGAVTGPTLAMIGENPASRGEAIIPFERMGSFLQQFGMGTNGDQHITISGQLAGDTIRLSGESATNKIGSVRWGRGTALVN